MLALILLLPVASAAATEVSLPKGWTGPTVVAFAPDGTLWVTLDGAWALGRLNLSTNESKLYPLATPKAEDQDTMWALRFAPDGTVWTATGTYVHHVDPVSGNDTTYKTPTATHLPGDIYLAKDGTVWIAQVDANQLLHLDPRTGKIDAKAPPGDTLGPLSFDETSDGTVYLTGSYGNTYAKFDPATGGVKLGPRVLDSPVGIAHDAQGLWVAEMGTSAISRIFPTSGGHARYPTSPSAYYSQSGPAGIIVAHDGSVWFAEHFADRIARLDITNRTLVEYEVPSAPGANIQRLVEGPGGVIWLAEFSKDQLGRVEYSGETFSAPLVDNVTLRAGESLDILVPVSGDIKIGSPHENLTIKALAGKVTLQASKTLPPGDYNILLASKNGKTTIGRYVTVHIDAAKNTPSAPLSLVVAAFVALALAWRRRA